MRVVCRYRYVHACADRHGNVRVYFRRRAGAPKIRLKEVPGTPAFDLEYQLALAAPVASQNAPQSHRVKRGNLGWLLEAYLRSSAFTRLSAVTKRRRKAMLERALAEKSAPGSRFDFGDCPLVKFEARHIKILIERKIRSGGAHAANNLLKAFRGFTRWAREFSYLDEDLAAHVKSVKSHSDGYRTWTEAEIETFRLHYPLGTLARAVLEIGVNTGLRRSDIVRLGPQHIVDGVLRMAAAKNKARLAVPVVPELQAALDALPYRGQAFVMTQYGCPFSAAGLGNWFRERCDAAGLEGLSLHGLRRSFATRLAEHGATELELMALAGWSDGKEARRYTKAANVEVLARAGIAKVMRNASPPSGNRVPAPDTYSAASSS